MTVYQLPARTDNYIYILRDDSAALTLVIDPTDSAPVMDFCKARDWTINHILLTHHHPDHITGVPELVQTYHSQTWGFGADQHRLPPLTHKLENKHTFSIGDFDFQVTHTPCHTLGHICFFVPQKNYLFSGDLIFSMGCGRFFEGTAEMALPHFQWLRTLPNNTTVFCSHEYTQVNTEFALALDPHNEKLKAFYTEVCKKRGTQTPTVPFPLEQEIELNPILRWDDPQLRRALHLEHASDVEVLHAVRHKRNQW